MATELRMPDMGTASGRVTFVRWLKEVGDTVSLGEALCEVETDKGVTGVEAALPGVLLSRLVTAGEKVGAEQPIALILRPGEPVDPRADSGPSPGNQ